MSVCAGAHAAASWRLRHFPACDTLPPGECEAAREFRALIAQLLSANCSMVRLSLKQLVTGNSIQGALCVHCNPGTVTSSREVRVCRRDGAAGRVRRWSGARCVAAVGCATLTKVKVIGAGAGRGISPTFAAVIHSSTHAPRQGRFPPLPRDSDPMLPSASIMLHRSAVQCGR